jgi:hypothetical protein
VLAPQSKLLPYGTKMDRNWVTEDVTVENGNDACRSLTVKYKYFSVFCCIYIQVTVAKKRRKRGRKNSNARYKIK